MKLHIKYISLSAISYLVLTPLFAAAVIDTATEPAASAAPYVLSNTDLEASGTKTAYRPWFENGAWQGDIIQYNITSLGELSTSLDLTTTPPEDDGTYTNWSARKVFSDIALVNDNFWSAGTDSRKIITSTTGTNQVSFKWASLTVDQQTAIGNNDILDYIRGDRSNELQATPPGTFRNRYSILGDIVHSNPVYIGAPASSFTFAGYSDYKNKNKPDGQADRNPIVYVGANDGMLHAFNANDGKEVFAYVPSMVFNNLNKLKASPYIHTYYVDGELNSGDLFNTVTNDWRTVLIGGLGSGGKGLFALDVTHASLSTETASSGEDKKILWEKTGGAFGYIHGKAQIAKLNDDQWYVIQGNGYNSADDVAKLLLIAPNGTVTEIATDTGITGNGLSSPALVDINNDSKPDYAYAGDIKGNLWKFDLTAKTAALKLFVTGVDQPITSVPDIARHPSGGIIIYFGTGSLLSGPNTTNADTSNTSAQAFYGIWDNNASTLITNDINNILNQPLTEAEYAAGTTIRYSTNNTDINWTTQKGWKVPFPTTGERLTGDPQLRGGRLQFITTSFNSDLQPVAWLMELNYLNGGASKVIFDLSGDTIFDGIDTVNRPLDINGAPIGTGNIPVAIKYGDYGIFSQPTIARINYASDTILVNGLLMPVAQPCTGTCTGGFIGGHMDVDTDSPFGGIKAQRDSSPNSGSDTDGHEHEYDKEHGVVFADWFDLEPRRGLFTLRVEGRDSDETSLETKLNRITEVCDPDDFTSPNHCETGTNPAQTAADKLFGGDDASLDKKFFIVLANADLNSGGNITIGAKTWNVKDYQDMITKKILDKANADVSTDTSFVDDEGASLVFTLRSILAADGNTGTLRISFDNRAIIEGKLLATQPGCHWGRNDPYDGDAGRNPSITNPLQSNYDAHITNAQENDVTGYRWRNGALTMQLVDAAKYKLQPIADTAHARNDATNPVGGTHVFNYTQTGFRDNGDRITSNQAVNANGIKESGLLYEGAIFNHWGALYKLRTGHDAVCYGHSRYNVSVAIEQAGLTLGEYNALTAPFEDNTTLQDAFKAAQAAYDANPTAENKAAFVQIITDNQLEDYMKYRTYIRAKIPSQHLLEWDKGLADEGTGGTNTPATVQEGTKNDSQVGQNFRTGRRTWIDLTP